MYFQLFSFYDIMDSESEDDSPPRSTRQEETTEHETIKSRVSNSEIHKEKKQMNQPSVSSLSSASSTTCLICLDNHSPVILNHEIEEDYFSFSFQCKCQYNIHLQCFEEWISVKKRCMICKKSYVNEEGEECNEEENNEMFDFGDLGSENEEDGGEEEDEEEGEHEDGDEGDDDEGGQEGGASEILRMIDREEDLYNDSFRIFFTRFYV